MVGCCSIAGFSLFLTDKPVTIEAKFSAVGDAVDAAETADSASKLYFFSGLNAAANLCSSLTLLATPPKLYSLSVLTNLANFFS